MSRPLTALPSNADNISHRSSALAQRDVRQIYREISNAAVKDAIRQYRATYEAAVTTFAGAA